MEFLQLKYFKTVARLQHMTKAAKKLNISQPALSKTINRLEVEIGVPLFNREGRKIILNEYGKMFLVRVNRIFKEVEDGDREIRDLANRLEESVSVAIVLPHFTPILLQEFLLQYPNTHIKQHSSSAGKTMKQLENFEIDFCISVEQIYGENIGWELLLNEPIYLSVSKDHKFANRESIALSEVANETFISFSNNFEIRRLVNKFCKEVGFEPHIKIELEDPMQILHLVETGFGVSFTPQLSSFQKNCVDTVQIPISHPIFERSIGIAWNKNHYLSKAALSFKEFVIEFFNHKSEIYDTNNKSIG